MYKKLESMYRKYDINRSYIRDPWEEQSKMGLFFIGKSVPPQIKKALEKYLTHIVVKYNTVEQPPADEKYRLNVIGESFTADFCSVINLANSIGLALTKEKQMLSKSVISKKLIRVLTLV